MTTADCVLDDRYELIERIATGGMSEVWRGSDQILDRPVAVKVLAAAHAEDERSRARFRAEAHYASSLAHPGITRVFDYGEHSPLGGPYLVMEFVDGQPLSEILQRQGQLEVDEVLNIVAQAARALDAAHRAGIVHRDIKPGNLLITADGTTKITDFGIAKASAQDVRLTQTGLVMGTALYVSPEQATGQPLTGSSDIYSLGVVAYECLAGRPPFVADQAVAVAIMHKHDPVPPLPKDVPRPVAKLVQAMLAKTPQGRPASARHVADRAEVIREARSRSGHSGPATSDVPVIPSLLPVTSLDLYQEPPERVPPPRPAGNRSFLLAGIGAGVIGAVAVIAILISGNDNSVSNLGSHTTLPTQTQSQPASHKASVHAGTTQPVSNLGGYLPGNLPPYMTGPTRTPAPSQPPAATRSPTPPATSPAPSTSPAPTNSPTPTSSPTTAPPTTAPPTTTPPTTTPPTTTPPTTAPPTTAPPTTAPPTTAPPTAPPPTTTPPTTSTTPPATSTATAAASS